MYEAPTSAGSSAQFSSSMVRLRPRLVSEPHAPFLHAVDFVPLLPARGAYTDEQHPHGPSREPRQIWDVRVTVGAACGPGRGVYRACCRTPAMLEERLRGIGLAFLRGEEPSPS